MLWNNNLNISLLQIENNYFHTNLDSESFPNKNPLSIGPILINRKYSPCSNMRNIKKYPIMIVVYNRCFRSHNYLEISMSIMVQKFKLCIWK